jgi:hypothetical protein
MKRTLLIILSLATATLNSCKKSEDNSTSPSNAANGFTINNKFFNTEKAGIVNMNDTIALIFYSGTVSFNVPEQHWQGTGNAIEFNELVSNSTSNGIPVGNYVFKHTIESGYFREATSRIHYNFTIDTGYEMEAIRGNITFSKVNNTLNITYNIKNSDSTSLIGQYSGTPQDISSWFPAKKIK